MLFNTLLQPLVLLSLFSTAFTSVVTQQRSEKLAKKDVNLQLLDFDELTLNGLTTAEIEQIFQSDMNNAIALAFGAQNALAQADVEDTPEFIRWFGAGADTAEVNQLLQGFQNVVSLFSPSNGQQITVVASNAYANTASGDVQAFVTNAQPQGMTIFRSYWDMRPSTAVVPPHPGTGNGGIASLESRPAILLHELFHFTFIIPESTGGATAAANPRYNEAYGQQACLQLATQDPQVALINPESLMYYALDVTYGWTRNQQNNPPPPQPTTTPLPSPPAGSSSGNRIDPLASFAPPSGASSWWGVIHPGSNSRPWADGGL